MPLLIDTYNVLHTVGVLPPDLAGLDVQGLIGLIAVSRHAPEKTTLVCDGAPKSVDAASLDDLGLDVTIRFAGPGKLADDLIGQLVTASTAPRRVIVVSSDHAVQRAARRRKCQTLTSEEFLQQLAEDARGLRRPSASPATGKPPPSAMTAAQLERWLSVFRIDDDLASIPSGSAIPLPELLDDDESQSDPGGPVGAHTRGPHAAEPDGATESDAGPISALPPPEPLPSVIPETLIEQAERLWSQELRAAAPKPTAPGQSASPPPSKPMSSPGAKSPPATPTASPDPAPGVDNLDMGSILPNDGKTKRWKRDDSR